jgi:hypothetical protein
LVDGRRYRECSNARWAKQCERNVQGHGDGWHRLSRQRWVGVSRAREKFPEFTLQDTPSGYPEARVMAGRRDLWYIYVDKWSELRSLGRDRHTRIGQEQEQVGWEWQPDEWIRTSVWMMEELGGGHQEGVAHLRSVGLRIYPRTYTA